MVPAACRGRILGDSPTSGRWRLKKYPSPSVGEFEPTEAKPKLAIDPLELRRNPPRLVNFSEVCTILDISPRHGRHLVAEKTLPAIRLGGRLLFDTSKVFAALERMSG